MNFHSGVRTPAGGVPGGLAQHDHLTVAAHLTTDERHERSAVDAVGLGQAEHLEHGGQDVDQRDHGRGLCGRDTTRRPEDQGYVGDRVVEAGVVEPGVVFGHVLPVVAEEDDQGVVEQVELTEVGEELADLEVEVGHLGVVEVGDVVEVGHCFEEVVEVLLEQRVARPALELVGDVGIDATGRPVREPLLERGRWKVGDVGIPEMEEEVELFGGVLVEPGEADAVDDRARRSRSARAVACSRRIPG